MTATHPIIFAGAGPGDPELITVKARRALREADLVVYAGSLVPEALLKWTKPEAEKINSAFLSLEDIISALETAFNQGKKVVRLHTGDPSLYGAVFEQMEELKKRSIPHQIIPGVTAAFAAAASMGIEYTIPGVSQTLILTRMAGRTPVPEKERLERLAGHQASMAIYLSISLIDEIAAILKKHYGPSARCAVAFRVSRPEEKIVYAQVSELKQTVRKHNILNHALIIVGKVLDAERMEKKTKSKLYDKDFSHGYRK